MDYGDANLVTDLVPKVAAYTLEKIKELIRLDGDDLARDKPRYKVICLGEKKVVHAYMMETVTEPHEICAL
jgi:hypothetical protein